METFEDENHAKNYRLFRTPGASRVTTPGEANRITDVGPGRLAEMDKNKIDMQVLLMAAPSAFGSMMISLSNVPSGVRAIPRPVIVMPSLASLASATFIESLPMSRPTTAVGAPFGIGLIP